jgi:thiamine biosynthesis lipoprotein
MGPRPAAGLDEGLASASRRTHGQASPADTALSIDLGGIGKGAAADLALALLADRGGHAALVDLGGHVVVRGQAGPGTPWRVGIRQACSAEEAARVGPSPRLLAWLEAGSAAGPGAEAIISSGQYERWRRTGRGGTEPAVLGHVMDPRTRAPVSGLIGTTVVHADAAWADAAATALLVAGPGGWPAVARGMGLDQVLVQHADGSVEASPALARRLHLVPGSPRRIQVRDPGTA